MDTPYPARLAQVVRAIQSADVDALLVTPGPDMLFLSGFAHAHAAERLLALVVRRDGAVHWVLPEMNLAQVRHAALPGQELLHWSDRQTYFPALRQVLAGCRTVAFDDEARAAFLLDVIETLPGVRARKASTLLRSLRIRKDAHALAELRAAGGVVDSCIPQAVRLCRPGRTEADVERELRQVLCAAANAAEPSGDGASVAFTIIASGPNAALPHHETGGRAMQQGDVVILDFGTRRASGYHSDITVTCAIGEPADPEVRKVYAVVYEAQQAALAAVRPGAPAQAVDRAARQVIDRAGYGPYFTHRTGHGLGLQVHEPPFMVEGNEDELEEGNVFSIEPGIYLPGRFGVRLEIITAVGPTGAAPVNAVSASELLSA